MQALADERGYDLAHCFAYFDSASDLPMLLAVGHPVVVNPEPEPRAIAQMRRWLIGGDLLGAAGETDLAEGPG